MSIELKMPALSPTMEKGTLAKWLVRVGDVIKSGDQVAEIETDKATMEFETADEGRIMQILVPEGTDDVAVGTVIALLGGEDEAPAPQGEDKAPAAPAAPAVPEPQDVSGPSEAAPAEPIKSTTPAPSPVPAPAAPHARLGDKVRISPLAARIARAKDIDVSVINGTGPGGRIVRADLGLKPINAAPEATPAAATSSAASAPIIEPIADVPHTLAKLSGMRKTIARRLTQSKQQVPHIYLSVDIRMDALLALRVQLNESLVSQDIKISVNDLMIKALAAALIQVPECNVQFAGDEMAQFERADISVAVSIPNGLITPIVKSADTRSISAIAVEMKELAERARAGRLQPAEYQGGTASLSNLGMFGIRQFQAVINPPQAMIMAIGAAELRSIPTKDGFEAAQMLSATGSFDHRAIDGADAARFMQAFKQLIEAPLRLIA